MVRKNATQTITNPESLDALVSVMELDIKRFEKEIMQKQLCILFQEERIRKIKNDGKFVTVIDSNVG